MRTILFCLSLLAIAQIFAQSTPTDVEAQLDEIFSRFAASDGPGVTVAAMQDGKIVCSKGYGSANLEYGIPNEPKTVFHVASVSKQFTVFAVLLLEEEGKLSLDDEVGKHLAEFPDFGHSITLRHLAAHTSGLRDQWNLLAMSGWRMDDVITREQILKIVARQKELNFPPGEQFLYCNTGFTLLGEVVARVSGKSFAEFTRDRIFQPLGMENTLFYDDHEKIVPNRAYSYQNDREEGYRKSVLNFANAGATSLFTTAEDMMKWATHFSQLRVGTAEMVEKMNTPARLNDGSTFGGGLGQFIDTYRGLSRIQHGGSDAGYRSFFARFPEQDFSVAVLSNAAHCNPYALAERVTDVFLSDQFGKSENTVDAAVDDGPSFVSLPNKRLKAFAGHYWNDESGYSRMIYLRNDTLRYSRGGMNESPLVPIGDNEFKMMEVAVDLRVSFPEKEKNQEMIVVIEGGRPIRSEKFTPAEYTSKELGQFAGSYYSEELATTYVLKVVDGKLTAHHYRGEDISFSPLKSDVFIEGPWFMNQLQFIRNEAGEVSGFLASGGRVKQLRFEKLVR